MQITIELPDELAHQLEASLGNLNRRAMESLIVEAYNLKILSAAEVQRILKLPSLPMLPMLFSSNMEPIFITPKPT